MATLDEFLQCTDLDDLLRAGHELSPLTTEDCERIKTIVSDWRDQQMISNLLFHPVVIPTDTRFSAIEKALCSTNSPYLCLAAVVGLQGINPAEVSTETGNKYRQLLLGLIQSACDIIARRASVTMFSWFSESQAGAVLSLYPVNDDTASKNILAFTLTLFGDLPANEYAQRVADCGVSNSMLPKFSDYRAEYAHKSSNGTPAADFMKCPLLCHIPNLCQVSVAPLKKQSWRFW